MMILELDIIDHLDQSFNLSDYPALVAFDGYHNMDLRNVDPTGCPELQVLSNRGTFEVHIVDFRGISIDFNNTLFVYNA